MKAYHLVEFGSLDGIKLQEDPTPKPGAREAVVRVRAVAQRARPAHSEEALPASCNSGNRAGKRRCGRSGRGGRGYDPGCGWRPCCGDLLSAVARRSDPNWAWSSGGVPGTGGSPSS